MAAIERAFSDFPPLHLCVDTNFLIDYMVPARPRHERVVAFLANVQRSIRTTFYVSSTMWTEFVHVICRRDFQDDLPDEYRQQYRLDQWAKDASVRQMYAQAHLKLLEGLLEQVNLVEVQVNTTVRQLAVRRMIAHNLGSQDAIHLASADVAGVRDLASFDKDFRRVDGLHLWNDQIYGAYVG